MNRSYLFLEIDEWNLFCSLFNPAAREHKTYIIMWWTAWPKIFARNFRGAGGDNGNRERRGARYWFWKGGATSPCHRRIERRVCVYGYVRLRSAATTPSHIVLQNIPKKTFFFFWNLNLFFSVECRILFIFVIFYRFGTLSCATFLYFYIPLYINHSASVNKTVRRNWKKSVNDFKEEECDILLGTTTLGRTVRQFYGRFFRSRCGVQVSTGHGRVIIE